MNTYSYTYWAPGATGSSVASVDAKEFAFSETHAVFIDDANHVVLAIPLTLQPIIRFAGPVTA